MIYSYLNNLKVDLRLCELGEDLPLCMTVTDKVLAVQETLLGSVGLSCGHTRTVSQIFNEIFQTFANAQ